MSSTPSQARTSSVPLVSCVMPTRNRRSFVQQAIWYFLRQDYECRELVIVDDGEDAVADLIPVDERIRYLHLDQRHTLGAKRNLGCELSRGEFIAHWDDDDWIAPHRLRVQVDTLLKHETDICGARELLHYRLDAGEAWLYRCADEARPWLAGGTLLYRRRAWAEHPFPEINVGEDSAFVWQYQRERISVLPDHSFYVALIHNGNTSTKRLADPHWQRRPLDEVSQLLALDRDFYVALRSGTNSQRSQVWQRPAAASVTVGAPFMIYDGYGSMAEFLVLGMARAGASVNVVPLSLDLKGMSQEFQQILQRSRPDTNAPVLYFCWPRPDLERFRQSEDLFISTMWESSRLPADWPARLNRTRAVIVPTKFVADVCRQSGVSVPLEVVPLGVDPDIYQLIERPARPGLTTLIIGTVIERKNVATGIAAWKLAFEGDESARLIIKSRFKYGNYVPDDPRIIFVDDNEKTRGISHWYEQADVLLALGNEGFGLPLVEAMATGLPVIALNSEGQSDACFEAKDCLLPVEPARWVEHNDGQFGRCGVRGVPSVEEVAAKLRWVAEHADEARALGQRASAWAHTHRNIWHMGPSVLGAMERHLHPSRPLSRNDTLWVSSWGTACGISEYTAHLAAHLPLARVTKQWPDLRGVRLLHIQHEHGIYNEAALTKYLQQARLSRVPLVLTEHSVKREPSPFEHQADVLIALTSTGTERLRQRQPDRQVLYIPHGCPTWFPPRKKKRGLVIGGFGFLEQHKGFWHLLDALRAIPEAELLLYSHARNADNAERWTRDAAGLRVRLHSDFLPVEEAAQRLAAEADILVYWYDDVPHASASGAVRVGLATGVPVLTSRTSWFEDLRGVTFQPTNLIEGVRQLLSDTELREQLTAAAYDYCHENSWPRTAERHQALWRTLDSR